MTHLARTLILASSLLLPLWGVGCASEEPAPEAEDGKVGEPIHEDRATAPPLGSPRPKLAPGEVVEDQEQ